MALSRGPSLALFLTLVAAVTVGCHKKEEAGEGHEEADEVESPDAGAHGPSAASTKPAATDHGEHGKTDRKFAIPFAWEASQADALAKTRGFLGAMSQDNTRYMRAHNEAFFTAFASAEKPRATVLGCSDSRVHTTAFSAAPENDDFMIRNIGNQLKNSEGSVEYGVHHLHTPVLLIMGHTGCSAVKAAMGDLSKESEPIKRELANLDVKGKAEEKHGRASEGSAHGAGDGGAPAEPTKAWSDAVVANVHHQVKASIVKFAKEIEEGQLTIVGVVYDFRNDLKQGFGKVIVVDVNGQTDHDRIVAFERAISGTAPTALAAEPHDDAHGAAPAKDTSQMTIQQLLQNAPLKASVRKSEPAKEPHDATPPPATPPPPAAPKTH